MKCPGQDSRYWKPGAIFEVKCPNCGGIVEFFKDDSARRCDHCGHRFVNPHLDFGCAAYCPYAEQCIGSLPPEVAAQKENLLKDRVAIEMKRYFKKDFKRIGHAMRVARCAERIGKETGADLAKVLAAAYLYDIGVPEAEKKYGSTDSKYVQQEGRIVARAILSRLGAAQPLQDAVCDIVGRRHPSDRNASLEEKIVHDADRIARLESRRNTGEQGPLSGESPDGIFMTESGRKAAERILQKTEG